jgi:hypothetical protein
MFTEVKPGRTQMLPSLDAQPRRDGVPPATPATDRRPVRLDPDSPDESRYIRSTDVAINPLPKRSASIDIRTLSPDLTDPIPDDSRVRADI